MPPAQQFTAEEQEILRRYGRKCYVNDHPIPEDEKVEFDHIEARGAGGPDEMDNKAPICVDHNRQKGADLTLMEFRDKLEMQEFFAGSEVKRLNDVLHHKVGSPGRDIRWQSGGGGSTVELWFAGGSRASVPLNTCPATGTQYFYVAVPFENLGNDDELQPRPLDPKRVWELYRHLKRNTLLAPAVCRLVGKRLLLFDGQHKAAAQVWAGRATMDCKVYVEPDARQLKDTNLTAHEKLRQMPFYTSILMRKYADIYKDDWNEYMGQSGEKSEAGFVQFLQAHRNKTRDAAIKEIRLFLVKNVMDSQEPANTLAATYVALSNRPGKRPLTHSLVQKTFFKEFLVAPPLDVAFESDSDLREHERRNLVLLMNMVAEETLVNRWNPDANDAEHRRAQRIYLAGAIRGWVVVLKNVVAQLLHLFDDDERRRVLFRPIEQQQWDIIRGRVAKLFSHPIWLKVDPSIDDALKANVPESTQEIFRREGLNAGWVLGGGS
jgi:hypothetical protein